MRGSERGPGTTKRDSEAPIVSGMDVPEALVEASGHGLIARELLNEDV